MPVEFIIDLEVRWQLKGTIQIQRVMPCLMVLYFGRWLVLPEYLEVLFYLDIIRWAWRFHRHPILEDNLCGCWPLEKCLLNKKELLL